MQKAMIRYSWQVPTTSNLKSTTEWYPGGTSRTGVIHIALHPVDTDGVLLTYGDQTVAWAQLVSRNEILAGEQHFLSAGLKGARYCDSGSGIQALSSNSCCSNFDLDFLESDESTQQADSPISRLDVGKDPFPLCHVFAHYGDYVTAFDYTKEGWCAVGTDSGALSFNHFATPAADRWQHGHNGRVRALAVNSFGNKVVSCGADGQLVEWSSDGKVQRTKTFPSWVVPTTVCYAGQDQIVFGDTEGRVFSDNPIHEVYKELDYIPFFQGEVSVMTYTAAANILAIGFSSGLILCQYEKEQSQRSLVIDVARVTALRFSEDGSRLFAASASGALIAVDM